MRKLVWLASARRDLANVLDYLTRESGSLPIAQGFVARLRHQCARLAELPGTLGRQRPELRPDIRSVPYQNYVIFFRYRANTVETVNILEGHRDVDGLFRSQ